VTAAVRAQTPAELPAVLGGFDLTDQARWARGVPYEVFAALRREAPVLRHPPGHSADGEAFWVLSRHADIVAAAGDPVFSGQGGAGRAGGGTHLDDLPMGVHAGALLPMMDDPRHELITRLVGPAFGREAVERLEPRLRAHAAQLIYRAVAAGGCDLPSGLAGAYTAGTMALLLEVPAADRDRLAGWLDEVVGIVGRRSGVPDAASQQTNGEIYRYARALLADRAARPDNDLTSLIATGQIAEEDDEPPLTAYERQINFLLFLQTGSEQPRNVLAGGLLALAEQPEQWRALRADRSLVAAAVEEMLRWTPPSPYNRRTATRDVDFGGVRIAAGDKVTLWWASANRDGSVFTDPDRFDIGRTPNPHLSFGSGQHACLGDRLARFQLRVFLEVLLDRVERIEATGPVVWSPSNKHTVMVSQPVRLVPNEMGTR
jgi:cytochrome P450